MKKILSYICSMALLLCLSLLIIGCNDQKIDDLVNKIENEYGIVVEGKFERGTKLVSSEIKKDTDEWKNVANLLVGQNYDKNGEIKILDIHISKDNQEVKLNATVKITVSAPFKSDNGYVIFHVKDDNSISKITPTLNNDKLTFEVDSFSYFVIAKVLGENTTLKYRFTLNIDSEYGKVYQNNQELSNGYNTKLSSGRRITLVAVANEGCKFIGWHNGNDILSTELEYELIIKEDMIITAKFTKVETFSLLITRNNLGGNFIFDDEEICGDIYRGNLPTGSTFIVKAKAILGYVFKGWFNENNELISNDLEYTIVINDKDLSIIAIFEETTSVP